MTKEEAIWWVNHLFEIRKEEYFNKGMMKDAKEVEEAQHIVIYALQVRAEGDGCGNDVDVEGLQGTDDISENYDYRKGDRKMMIEETIKWLESLKAEIGKPEHRSLWHYAEAIDMAIEALERERQRQEDIYECQYCFGEVHKNYTYCPFCGERTDGIMLSLAKKPLADRPRGEWIPCTEKMPDDGRWAIWCSSDGVIGIARFKEDCYDHFYPNETSFDLEDAVAWMPLPEPFYSIDMRGKDE